jgi:hypothetical protein
MFNMLVHCASLGNTPNISNIHNSFKVSESHPIEHVWDWVAACSDRNGRIKNLLIACHGGYADLDNTQGPAGGFGILLGTGITKYNVQLTRKLLGRVSNIYMFVCGGGRQIPDNLESSMSQSSWHPDYANNNRQICMDIAAYSEANVYASSEIQKYGNSFWLDRFDFGAWEGKVEKFSPYGGVTDVTSRMQAFGKESGNE